MRQVLKPVFFTEIKTELEDRVTEIKKTAQKIRQKIKGTWKLKIDGHKRRRYWSCMFEYCDYGFS